MPPARYFCPGASYDRQMTDEGRDQDGTGDATDEPDDDDGEGDHRLDGDQEQHPVRDRRRGDDCEHLRGGDRDHLSDLADGAGCAEVWEHVSARRDGGDGDDPDGDDRRPEAGCG
jgi:hypothetical protein